ncbi:MAG TPA: hypothetical protein VFZ59_07275 [Verrucomicrobiae bacterium]|nr:hypothetical protein [Verrucomicrobiae bacterium]
MKAPGNFVIGVAAEEFDLSLRPPRDAWAIGDAEMPPLARNGLDGAIESPRNLLIGCRAKQANVSEFPLSYFVLKEGWDAQFDSLIANGVFGAPESPREFQIGEAAQQSDFARRPATWRHAHSDAPAFTLGDDFFDGASGSARQNGVGCSAELFQLGNRPRGITAGFRSGGHGSDQFRSHSGGEEVGREPNETIIDKSRGASGRPLPIRLLRVAVMVPEEWLTWD